MNFMLSGENDRWPEVVDVGVSAESYDSDKLPEPFLEGKGAHSASVTKPLKGRKGVQKTEVISSCALCAKANGSASLPCPHSGVMPTGICCFNMGLKKHQVMCS